MSTAAYTAGLDIGSTTMKMVVLRGGEMVWSRYERHCADVEGLLAEFLEQASAAAGEEPLQLQLTGSVGMGVAESLGLPFVQEVVAATHYMQQRQTGVATMIDIGGEDAKVVFMKEGAVADLRMNGNCSGGTGAFIDQMAALMGVSVPELGELALRAEKTYPLASRCGVFCKTDIQNLLARGAGKEDIAASVFRAIAVQTVTTLAHGSDISPPVLLCGGPLRHLPALRRAFAEYLHLDEERDFVLPEEGHLLPAVGAALSPQGEPASLRELARRVLAGRGEAAHACPRLAPLFADPEEHRRWREEHARATLRRAELSPGVQKAWLGVDSGSTTTKVVLIDEEGALLYSAYRYNDGQPLSAVSAALAELRERCEAAGTRLHLCGSCSTGYGEDLIRAAFHLDAGIVETMAHYMAARHLEPEVSFILDIGGQDMKAVFVREGSIHRMEINEACSSGCGSFISTFAQSLGLSLREFTRAACYAPAPCDLGTRCTVFMNSRIKQVLRQGAGQADIAAGLSYSVVRNCLYKVLQLRRPEELGKHIVVQGGAMLNDAVVRGFERLTGVSVVRSERPELMGAYGCALYAAARGKGSAESAVPDAPQYTSRLLHCGGCENRCEVTCYDFGHARKYFSGNRCESVFTNSGKAADRAPNIFPIKEKLLFDRPCSVVNPRLRLGIPRCLNMYEEFPFWHALFTHCGIEPVLSARSTQALYEGSVGKVMSDNICFPAKLVHGHIRDLQQRAVDRIFMPFVLHEKRDKGQHESFNCPVVSGYSEVVKSVQSELPVDAPSISFRDAALLRRQCVEYLARLGVSAGEARAAFAAAWAAHEAYEQELLQRNTDILQGALAAGRMVILLAGRPYHTDPLIQHKVSDMVAAMGIAVVNEDMVRAADTRVPRGPYLPQWAYPNRILRAAQWVNSQPSAVQMVQLTSFGCGPDALLADAVAGVLRSSGRNLTLLKIDDVSNTGSLKLRIRSLVESLRLQEEAPAAPAAAPEELTLPFTAAERRRTILAPFFSDYISPLVPALLGQMGHRFVVLPPSDEESLEWGLQYCNNEMCYPAVLVVGDIIRAFRSGRYKPEECAVAITQTGGQCRASNYLPLIRKALLENGYKDTPVVALAPGKALDHEQPGFHLNWLRLLPLALDALLFADCISRFYHASAVREKQPGQALALRERFLRAGSELIERGKRRELYPLVAEAAQEFAAICRAVECARVGIVGEIYLKFNPFAQRNVVQWLMQRGIEVVPPMLTPFFTQSLVNYRARWQTHMAKRLLPDAALNWLQGLILKRIERANKIASAFPYFIPIENTSELAELGGRVVNLNAQFGEGWLIPAEVLSYAQKGITHVISLQPFGCIANHIVQKGIENKLRRLAPQVSLLSLDFDSSVSDVNIANRLLLFIDNLQPVASPS
ncbi:MAG: 2-hydroxyacyl-CoA dehydratase [Akkermansiaceae bacterium]|nr:2-hydroxyacyl-CoA dehydratase [Akkermansiaceae bacterium]